jgi:hypothetical protein
VGSRIGPSQCMHIGQKGLVPHKGLKWPRSCPRARWDNVVLICVDGRVQWGSAIVSEGSAKSAARHYVHPLDARQFSRLVDWHARLLWVKGWESAWPRWQ